MQLTTMRKSSRKQLALNVTIALAMAVLLAGVGALRVATLVPNNHLDNIQLVQEGDELEYPPELDEGEAAEGGEDAEDAEGGEVGEDAEVGEVGEGAEDAEDAEGGEVDEGGGAETDFAIADADGASTTSFTPGQQGRLAVRNLTPNEDYDVVAESEEAEDDNEVGAARTQSSGRKIGSGRTDSGGTLRTRFQIPFNVRLGNVTITVKPEDLGGVIRNHVLKIVSTRNESSLASTTVGAAVLIALVGIVFTVVRRRRARST